MSIFSGLFGGNGGISHGAGGPTAIPVMQGQQQNPAAPANAAIGAATQEAPPVPASSPLDTLKAFWDTPKDAEGKPIQPQEDPTSTDIFNFDPVKVSESARKLNFTSDLNPELVQKALGGDAQAFLDVINHTSQTAFTAATLNAGKLINQGHATNNQRVKSTLPTAIKQVQLSQTEASNPIFNHEAAQPLVAALKKMAFDRNPSANPNDVQKSVESMLFGLSTAIAEASPESQVKQQQAAAKSGETDWSTFA